MTKIPIYSIEGKQQGQIELPELFSEAVRTDVILRAFRAYRAGIMQPQGSFPEAGKRASAKLSRRRRDYKGAYGIGISRVPRKTVWHRGTQFGWVGAFAPLTVGGRRAHPPKATDIHAQKVNKKEKRLALRSALAASAHPNLVQSRGHRIDNKETPIVVLKEIEALKKSQQVNELFAKLGLQNELERCMVTKVRAGRGKVRGRRYRKKRGVLIIVSGRCSLMNAAQNLPGVEVSEVNKVTIDMLAPGGMPGRLIVISDAAVKKIQEENLFIDK